MFLIDLLFAFFIALFLAAILSAAARGHGTDGAIALPLFLVLLLVTWAGGIWIRPFGPAFMGVSWLPFLLAGVIAAFLLAALDAARSRDEGDAAFPEEREEEAATAGLIGVLAAAVWIVIVLSVVSIAARYLWVV